MSNTMQLNHSLMLLYGGEYCLMYRCSSRYTLSRTSCALLSASAYVRICESMILIMTIGKVVLSIKIYRSRMIDCVFKLVVFVVVHDLLVIFY